MTLILVSGLNHFFLFGHYLCYVMGLTFRVAKICGDGHSKRLHSGKAYISSHEYVKCPDRAGTSRAPAARVLAILELDGVPVPCRAPADSYGCGVFVVEVDKRVFGFRYCADVVITTVRSVGTWRKIGLRLRR